MSFELQHDSIAAFLSQDFQPSSFYAAVQSFVRLWFSQAPILQNTSGSTGKPKVFELDRVAMRASAQISCSYFDLRKGDIALLCLPVEYIAGKMMVIRALEAGLRLLLVAPQANPLKTINIDIDFTAMVPTQLQASLQELDRVKKLIIGGAPTPAALVAALQGKPTRCWATYGMTETFSHIAVKPLNPLSPQALYHALPEVRLTQDKRGCLVIQAPALGVRQLVTNDVVELIDETEFRWLGRIDHVVNSGGVKVFPERIEEQLSSYFSKRFFISGQKDTKWGEKLILLLESTPFKVEESHFQRLGLAPYEIPKTVYFLPRFVETPNGKIQRAQTLNRLLEDKIQGVDLSE